MDAENDWDAFKARLEYHKHLFDRVKLQEEVRDRWFNYYLLIMAPTVTIMGIALKEMESAPFRYSSRRSAYFLASWVLFSFKST